MEELFAKRCVLVGKGKQLIKYVLVTGEAGTGKSTLARKLAYIWARSLHDMFIVYVILIRNLRESNYNNPDSCFHAPTLATAVVREYF